MLVRRSELGKNGPVPQAVVTANCRGARHKEMNDPAPEYIQAPPSPPLLPPIMPAASRKMVRYSTNDPLISE